MGKVAKRRKKSCERVGEMNWNGDGGKEGKGDFGG